MRAIDADALLKKTINNPLHAPYIVEKDIKEMPTIQPVATDTNVGDTISRQAAIDAINEYDFDFPNYMERFVTELRDAMKADLKHDIEALPPAQPEQIWILCDEKMPGEHEWIGTKKFGTTKSDEVYVTFENPKGERFCRHLCFQNGGLSDYDKQLIDTWFKGSKPIAWMPLPEPWNGGKEGK